MAHKGPSKEAILEFVEKVEKGGAAKALKNGWYEFQQCPFPDCGSDTGAAILVEPTREGGAWPGHFTCLSTKHPSGTASVGFRTLLKALGHEAGPWASGAVYGLGGRFGGGPGRGLAKPEEPLPIQDGTRAMREALLADDKAMAWMLAKFGLGPAEVRAFGLGKSKCGKRLVIPYFIHGKPVMYKSRNLYVNSGKEREFRRQPTGLRAEPPYNLDSLLNFVEYGLDDEKAIVVVEGESDCWTFRRLFPNGAVVAAPGGRNVPDLLSFYLSKVETRGIPRIVVIPDKDDSDGENHLVGEIARRVGASKVMVCELPDHETYKDLTDWVIGDCWTADSTRHWMRDVVKPAPSGRVISLSAAIKGRKDVPINNDTGLSFHLEKCDSFLSREGLTVPHFEAGTVSLFAGPSGHGKSTMILRAAIKSAAAGIPGCYCSSDQSKGAIADYATRIMTNSSPGSVGALEKAYKQSIRFETSSLYILDSSNSIPLEEWPNFAREGVAAFGWKHIIIDNLTSLVGIGADASDRASQWGRMALKIASELGVHIMFMAHIIKVDGNPLYWKRLNKNDIYYFRGLQTIIDYLFILQCKERPGEADDSNEISRCALFSCGKIRGKPHPPVQLMFSEDFSSVSERDKAFTLNLDIDPHGITDEEVASRLGINVPGIKKAKG